MRNTLYVSFTLMEFKPELFQVSYHDLTIAQKPYNDILC